MRERRYLSISDIILLVDKNLILFERPVSSYLKYAVDILVSICCNFNLYYKSSIWLVFCKLY